MESQLKDNSKNLKRGFLTRSIPMWVFIMCLIVLGAALAWWIAKNKSSVYSYTLNVPASNNAKLELNYGALPALSNTDYFQKVRQSLLNQKTAFIEADLSNMKITMYENGQTIGEVPIITKGKEGSWWETPAGLYKIETKETKHFSSIGKVYQPWSMAFQGNFFVHGWPYYSDGTEVSSTFSGGCIRLKTDDAKIVYDFAKVGMPILVYEKDFGRDSFAYSLKQPELGARAFLAADLKSDSVLLEKGARDQAPIASITKLVSALVAAEYINLDKSIAITSSDITTTSKQRLKVGQEITTYNLLFPLLMESSNEAALALANQLGKNRFVSLMNQKAKSLGMDSTRFADAWGADAGNVSTPEDLFSLAKYIYNNRSFVFKMSSGQITSSAYGKPVFQNLGNFNIVPGVTDKFIGGKIGKTTAAGETYMGVFEVDIRGEKRPIVIVVLDSTDVYADVRTILNHIHLTYSGY